MIIGVLFFSFFAVFFAHRYWETGLILYLVKLCYDILIIYFLLNRSKAKSKDFSTFSRIIASTHTVFPLFYVAAETEPLVNVDYIFILLLFGMAIVGLAIIDLSHSFGILPANRGVKSKGFYSFVRHPLYFGYIITAIGIVCMNFTVSNVALFGLYLALTHLRINREERLLSQSEEYIDYQRAVPSRILPWIY